MNVHDSSIRTGRGDGGDREAPSAIVNASQTLIRWLYSLAVICLTLTVSAPWFTHALFQYQQRIAMAMNVPTIWTEQNILIATGAAAALPALNALCLLNCGAALRQFSRTRLVNDLHRAMRRLRTVWFMAALTALLMAASLVTAVVRNWPR
jgi:hypothetical protein